MSDLETILARIKKMQAEREAEGTLGYSQKGGSVKDKWREIGFDGGLEWVRNEIESILADNATKTVVTKNTPGF
jgi:hypothetical protein